jgi:hypothetical protein
MARKTLVPEEKWEGLRQAMEEAAGARKTAGSSGIVRDAGRSVDAARPESGTKPPGERKGEKEKSESARKEKEKKKDKKERKEKKKKKKGKKKGKKAKKKGKKKG